MLRSLVLGIDGYFPFHCQVLFNEQEDYIIVTKVDSST
jgi:hypothetical protein